LFRGPTWQLFEWFDFPFEGEKMSAVGVDLVKKMYEQALSIRRFEQVGIENYRLGNIRGYYHPYLGEEGIAVGVISALNPDDYITSTHRGHGHCIAKGHDPRRMFAEVFGRASGYCQGIGGSMHISSRALNNLGANGIVAGGIPIAAGAAMGIKQKGGQQVVVCFFSDGATNNGTFHEGLNISALFNLPVIFVLENNQYAVSTPISQSTLCGDLAERAAGYCMPGYSCEGNDALEVYQIIQEPIRRARAGEGPSLVEFKTYRHSGHHVNDPGAYMPQEELAYWKAKDPVDILKKRLLEMGVSKTEIEAIEAQVEKEMQEGVEFALQSPQLTWEEFERQFVEP
jgi:acetoin:2,6-dichlorophenolindophenol oxidoreductase subunit alpha